MILDNIIITKVFDVMTIPIDCGTARQIQNRFAYGLSFCATPGGKLVYSHNGKEYISDNSNIILLPMGQTYTLYGEKPGLFPLINFYCDDAFKIDVFELFDINGLSYYLKKYEYIKTMCAYNQPYCNARAISAFYELLSHLMVNPFPSESDILKPAITYIDSHFSDPCLTINQAAQIAHISTGYFRRAFKSKYSVSPKTYIMNARINKAKELLGGASFLSIADVATKCGFTNVYHFDRVFKENVGCTPTEYSRRFGQMLKNV